MRTLTRLLFLVGLLGCGGVDDSDTTTSTDGGTTVSATCHHADARCSQTCTTCH